MPLDHSHSKQSFTNNVKTLMNDVGKSPHVQSRKQALAIAFATDREPKGRAMGGVAPGMPGLGQMANPGGIMSQAFNPAGPPGAAQPQGVVPQAMMGQPDQMNAGMPGVRGLATGGIAGPKMFKGPIVSSVPGRTDNHEAHVPSGSFVIPADIVSGHGQGNTLAGMNTLQKLFKMGPHASAPKVGGASSLPKLAKGGGASSHVGKPVKVLLAGGEVVVPPENAHETMCRITGKKLTLDEAHSAMDKWIINERKKLVKTLKKLPPPAKD
jgi:hypothetical protein